MVGTQQQQYDSVKVAEHLRYKAAQRLGISLNKSQVMHLLYILYGFYLARYEQRLTDEAPLARLDGPSFPRVERYLSMRNAPEPYQAIESNAELAAMVNQLVDQLGQFSEQELANWAQRVGSPWYTVFSAEGDQPQPTIPDRLMASYFKQFELA